MFYSYMVYCELVVTLIQTGIHAIVVSFEAIYNFSPWSNIKNWTLL